MESKYPQLFSYTHREFRQALKKADPTILDEALKFLVDDPRTIGSGYIKESIWRYMPRYALTDPQLLILEQVALKYLERGICREFKWMSLTMARIANQDFWDKVKALLTSDNPRIQNNATCLYPYSEGVNAGEQQRLKRGRQRRKDPYRYDRGLEDEDSFYSIIINKENWQEGKVFRQIPDDSELPILYYFRSMDLLGRKLASLNMRKCIPHIMLSKLEKILMVETPHNWNSSISLYCIYLMEKINDARAVPILISFLEQKVDWKFESPSKWIVYRATFNVFYHYKTPEAMQAIKSRPDQEQLMNEGVAEGYGWLLKKIP